MEVVHQAHVVCDRKKKMNLRSPPALYLCNKAACSWAIKLSVQLRRADLCLVFAVCRLRATRACAQQPSAERLKSRP